MADPLFLGPPEVIAAHFEVGPGPASTLANMLVWITETISRELASALSTVNVAATAPQWIGVSGLASGTKSGVLNAGLQTLGDWTAHKVAVTQAAVDAYTMAASTVVPSVVSQTNRDEWAALLASNILGQNTPAIIERDMEYFGEHWPHNSSVGATYSAAMTGLAAALSVPPPPSFAGAPAGLDESAAVAPGEEALQSAMPAAQSSAQAAASPGQLTGQFGSFLQQGPQLISSATEPVKSVGQTSGQLFGSFSALPQTLLGSFSASPDSPVAVDAASEPWPVGTGAAASLGSGTGGVGGYAGAGLTSFTRPASTFDADGGRPTGRAGLLSETGLRSPTSGVPLGRGMLPMLPASAVDRPAAGAGREEVTRARVVARDRDDPR